MSAAHSLNSDELRELKRRKASRSMDRAAPFFVGSVFACVALSLVHPLAGLAAVAVSVISYFGVRNYFGRQPNPELEAEIRAEFQAERNQKQDAKLLRVAQRFRMGGRRDHADILLNILRLKRRLEARMDKDEAPVGTEANINILVSEISDGIAEHLRQLAIIEDKLPSVLLSGNERGFAASEAKRADHLRQIREAYSVLMETSDILQVAHRPPVMPPPLPGVRKGPVGPAKSLDKYIEALSNENAVARRVREFLEVDLLIEEDGEFIDDQAWADLQDF